ncbi:MAG: membrane-binding protein, partial [Cyclobacteriaceae bacterium]|nr:membrane-binding protein [Cyclobacteriaceae bacterium]
GILILYFMILSVVFKVQGQDTYTEVYTYHDLEKEKIKEIYYIKDTISKILEGKYLSYYLNGKIESSGQFNKNEAIGVWEFYFETGSLKMKMEVLEDNTGAWKYYYENGNKSMEGLLKDGKRVGKWRHYYENGNLKSEGNFLNNKMEGPWHFYSEDGNLKGDIVYSGNKGSYKEYYANGDVKAEGPKSGLNNTGTWNYYHNKKNPDGSKIIQASGDYYNGKRTGDWEFFHLNGNISARGSYENNEPQGNWEYYYENGKLSSTGGFEEGLKNGDWSLFYPNGKLKGKGDFKSGTGEYREYYENGSIKIKGQLLNGKNEGDWSYYFPDGKLEGECTFTAGRGIYYGYYTDGTLKTKGLIVDDIRVGSWELYRRDGSLSGYYKPFFNDPAVSNDVLEPTSGVVPVKKGGIADYRFRSSKFSYFDSKINEYQGVIIGSNPILGFAGKIPFAMEFYMQERLGHEFEFEGLRVPFFQGEGSIPLDQVFSRGYSISLKQKFYNPHKKLGLWYFGHEIQFVNFGHFSKIEPPLIGGDPIKVSASEQRLLYNVIVGYRLMESTYQTGFTIDGFVGMGVGLRKFDVINDFSTAFDGLPQNRVPVLFRFGLNFGYNFSFGRWR